MTLENVREVQEAVNVMCKYCKQGLCDICPDKETLRQVQKEYEDRHGGRIVGIVIEHDVDDFGYWEGFNLTEDEENAIWNILGRHDTEGCSMRGTREDIIEEIN